MNIAILGASGLIGHKLFQVISGARHSVTGMIHRSKDEFGDVPFLQGTNIIEGVDVLEFEQLCGMLRTIKPDVVLNCVGITKRKDEVNDLETAIGINALFPHMLARFAKDSGFRVIHFSTDCVFNGEYGNYDELSPTSAEDIYGKTKALGEIAYDHTLTIRSSFIGRELAGKTELLDWFLKQNGQTISGYTEAFYSGVSTSFMSRLVLDIIENHPQLCGLYQLGLENPVSKYELLCIARDSFGYNTTINPDASFKTRPTLNGGKLRKALGVEIPSWKLMMDEIAADTLYQQVNCQ